MLLENMIKLCDTLTPVENDIANYILQNKEKVINLSIQQLSETIYTSKSSIHRFCKKIGFYGFNELKVKLAQDLQIITKDKNIINVNYPFEQDDTQQMIADRLLKLYEITIRDTYNYIDLKQLSIITNLLHDAKIIDIYTHAHNLNPAENFQDKMLTIGRIVNCPKSFYNQRMNVLASNHEHVALILSYSGKASFILPIIKALYDKKIPIVLIGKAGSNLYPQYISRHLYISDKEDLRDRISQFSSHIALQYMLDVVFGCIYNIDRKKNIEYLHKTINFMDDRYDGRQK
ncbi:MurR/RpiR family transcriptional regulator [Anaerosacchariphilus polymeriproducens]|uniref:MurR/RpiR family transcriptional regulator n=1 Tax=Anaerosacchariphilus polymeriproducens TaxID=1812858 RepID=A0A371AZF0_9FIRM|nr:MurR/RpiR family transcriptional regulator [Anaerosacchariphilus polymeriproducens]RDU24988.1 MurR/RpiR family transcriptional regulator [Anaerosacchariphilus polymeriproducens]